MKVIDWLPVTPSTDGAGVKILRAADFQSGRLDPFLMIDHLASDNPDDYMAGFPEHPHRGLETFTYMISGGFEHRDQMGNVKPITAGHVQWMSTGFGVVHSEMPIPSEQSEFLGFQIWVNMAAKDKLRPAIYQDSLASGVPMIEREDGVSIKFLSGQWHVDGNNKKGAVEDMSANAAIMDVALAPGAAFEMDDIDAERVVLFLFQGGIEDPNMHAPKCLILDPAEGIRVKALDQGARLLILKGNPLREPIAHMGPFVMNTEHELQQAISDYQRGLMGRIEDR